MSRRLAPALLVAWTLFVWATRIRNIATDTDLAGFEKVWRTGLAVALVAAALAGVVSLVTKRGLRSVIGALAGLTVITWVIRGISIAVADHSAAFVAVHLVLAVVSIGLALWAIRSLWSTDQPGKASETVPSSTSKFARSSS